VLGFVRREAEEDLGDDIIEQRGWRRRRHGAVSWFVWKSRQATALC
jgi:hypothetical protein